MNRLRFLSLLAALAAATSCRHQLGFTIPVCDDVNLNCRCEVKGWIICDDVCVNPQFDPNYCGGCDSACSGGAVCVNGACANDCGNLGQCGATCAYPDDPANCGGCGIACDGLCKGGQCMKPQSPAEMCGNFPMMLCGSSCVNVETDANNCGSCGHVCPTGCDIGSCCNGRICNGHCVDTNYDDHNCGACGNDCGSMAYCSSGYCNAF
jgi:hypothetical protein